MHVVEELLVRRLLGGAATAAAVDEGLTLLGYVDPEGWLWDVLEEDVPTTVDAPLNSDGSSTLRAVRRFLMGWHRRLAEALHHGELDDARPLALLDLRPGVRLSPCGRLAKPLPLTPEPDGVDALVYWLRVAWLQRMPPEEPPLVDVVVPLEMRSFDRIARTRRASSDLPRIGYRRNSSKNVMESLQGWRRPITVATSSVSSEGVRGTMDSAALDWSLPSLTRNYSHNRWAVGAGSGSSPDAMSTSSGRAADGVRFSRLRVRPADVLLTPTGQQAPRTGTAGASLTLGRATRLFVPSQTWTS